MGQPGLPTETAGDVKNMKLNKRKEILLLSALASAVLLWLSAPTRTMPLQFESIALEAVSNSKWSDVCFVPGYDSAGPNSVPMKFDECWQGRRAPERTTFLMLFAPGDTCELYSVKSDFLVKHGAETRCFPREDVLDLQLTNKAFSAWAQQR